MKLLYPTDDTRNETAKMVGCLFGVPITAALFGIVLYLLSATVFRVFSAGGFYFVIAAIAMGIMIGTSISNAFARQWRNIANTKLEMPVVSISPEIIRAGSSFVVTYHQPIRKSVTIDRLILKLVRVTTFRKYRLELDFYDKVGEQEQVYKTIIRKGRDFRIGDIFHREIIFEIPGNAPPTTETKEQTENWLIHVRVQLRGWFDFEQDYVLHIFSAQTIETI